MSTAPSSIARSSSSPSPSTSEGSGWTPTQSFPSTSSSNSLRGSSPFSSPSSMQAADAVATFSSPWTYPLQASPGSEQATLGRERTSRAPVATRPHPHRHRRLVHPANLRRIVPQPGSHLERYARVLPCAEINSTFYRSPRPSTLTRWSASVPSSFRFSVKAPKSITHEAALAPSAAELRAFLNEARLLGTALGPILFQLPPKLAFDPARARLSLTSFASSTPVPSLSKPGTPPGLPPKPILSFSSYK